MNTRSLLRFTVDTCAWTILLIVVMFIFTVTLETVVVAYR